MRLFIFIILFNLITGRLMANEIIPNRLLIKINKQSLKKLDTQKFNQGFTGISAIDKLNQTYHAVKVEHLFPFYKHKGSPAHPVTLNQWLRIFYKNSEEISRLIKTYQELPEVLYAEPSIIVNIDKTPNDPKVGSQWHLEQSNDHDVDAFEAWDVGTGDSSVIVAVMDTGVRYFHQDLGGSNASYSHPENSLGNMWINWPEKNGIDGVDDDGNGKIDDWIGWDFVSGDSEYFNLGDDYDVEDNDPRDYDGHGTHCAGNVAAINNNSLGVCAVAGGWGENANHRGNGVEIMALRIGWYDFPYSRVGMTFAADAFTYAADNGAKIASCSWGNEYSKYLSDAVNYFLFNTTDSLSPDQKVRLIFNAAGNSKSTSHSYLSGRPDVISVAATDTLDLKADFSNYGTWVDISAPGTDIYSTYHDHNNPETDSYTTESGTSMSTPIAASVAALVWSINPNLSASQVEQMLFDSADDLDALNPSYVGELGAGRVNAYAAAQLADQSLPVTLHSFKATIIPKGILLSWKTESEVENLGFNLWKSEGNDKNFYLLATFTKDSSLRGLGSSSIGKEYQYLDYGIENGKTYYYQLEDISLTGEHKKHHILKIEFENLMPEQIYLSQNFPNPFNGATQFKIKNPEKFHSQIIRVIVFDLLGHQIKTLFAGRLNTKVHTFIWNGKNDLGKPVSSGLYYYGVETKNFRQFKKLLLIK